MGYAIGGLEAQQAAKLETSDNNEFVSAQSLEGEADPAAEAEEVAEGESAEEGAAEEAEEEAEPAGEEFTITIDRSGGERLGMDMDAGESDSLLITAITGGLAEKWNTENAEQTVDAGYRIVEINGLRG